MVVDDLDIERVAAFKTKAQSPLFVYADTPLAGSIALQGFEAIGRRLAQILGLGSEMQVLQATDRTTHNIPWKPPRRSGSKQPLRFLVGETPYRYSIINNVFIAFKRAGLADV